MRASCSQHLCPSLRSPYNVEIIELPQQLQWLCVQHSLDQSQAAHAHVILSPEPTKQQHGIEGCMLKAVGGLETR